MKKIVLALTTSIALLSAQNIKKDELENIQKQKEKSLLESQLLKDSWINSIDLSADYTKNKNSNSFKSSSKKIYLNFNQDVFRSGGILYTIKKAKQQEILANETYNNQINSLNIDINSLVLQINKIDLQIKKQDYLIKNKTLEVEKKQEQYLNSTIDIEELDTVVIEKNDLLNQIEDLKISKDDLIKQLKKLSSHNYKNINTLDLQLVDLDEYLNNNQKLIIEKLNSNISKIDEDITATNYLPKVSLFSQIGYEDDSSSKEDGNYYNYGLRFTIPLDYNMNKNKEIAKVNYRLSKVSYKLKLDDEKNQYDTIVKSIKSIDKKLKNSAHSIKKYEDIYALTKDLYEGLIKTKQDLQTIENRLNSSKLDIDILKIDKQLAIYNLHKSLKKAN